MTLFETIVTEGSEKADELAKDVAMMDGGEMAQIRASAVQQQTARFTQRCNVQPAFIDWWRNGQTAKNLSRSRKTSGHL